MLLALIVAIDDLQEEAGQRDQFAVWSRKEAFQEAVTGLIKKNEDGQRVVGLEQQSKLKSQDKNPICGESPHPHTTSFL